MTAVPLQPASDDDKLGPVDFLAIEFPGGRLTAPGFEQLLSLADRPRRGHPGYGVHHQGRRRQQQEN